MEIRYKDGIEKDTPKCLDWTKGNSTIFMAKGYKRAKIYKAPLMLY